MYRQTVFVAIVCFGSFLAYADSSIESRGQLGIESRVFTQKGQGDRQNVAVVGRLNVDAERKPFELRARVFVRHDSLDDERSAPFPEDVWAGVDKGRLRLRVGYQLQTWSEMDAFHPADIINSRYLDGDVRNPEKVGEPTASLRLKILAGHVEGFFMPFFTEPFLPSSHSRFRLAPLGVRPSAIQILDHSGEYSQRSFHPQWATRVTQTVGDANFSAHVVQHIDRSLPIFSADSMSGTMTVIYQHVTQVGGSYQHVLGPVVLRLEGAYRRFTPADESPMMAPLPERNHTLAAAGIEWGIGHDSGGESTFIGEAQSAFGLGDANAGMLVFQRDALLGYRYDFGDEAGQSITSSVVVDMKKPEQVFGSIEYSRRIGETWSTQVGYRLMRFPPADPKNPVGPEFLHNSNYAFLNVMRFF